MHLCYMATTWTTCTMAMCTGSIARPTGCTTTNALPANALTVPIRAQSVFAPIAPARLVTTTTVSAPTVPMPVTTAHAPIAPARRAPTLAEQAVSNRSARHPMDDGPNREARFSARVVSDEHQCHEERQRGDGHAEGRPRRAGPVHVTSARRPSEMVHQARHPRRLEIAGVTPRIVRPWLRQGDVDVPDCGNRCWARPVTGGRCGRY
jgi:hypothetical protein